MVSYLYCFDPLIGINEIGIYLWASLANPLHKGKRVRQESIYFNFRLDIGVCNFNHANEFFSVSKLLQIRRYKIPIHSTKGFEDIAERFLFNLFDTSTISQITESACKIVLFLIAADCFSFVIVTEVYCMQFLRILG